MREHGDELAPDRATAMLTRLPSTSATPAVRPVMRPSRMRRSGQHPVILAFVARNVLEGAVDGARQGYRTTRGELSGLVPPPAISAALKDLCAEGLRLSAALRSVELVEWALRGR